MFYEAKDAASAGSPRQLAQQLCRAARQFSLRSPAHRPHRHPTPVQKDSGTQEYSTALCKQKAVSTPVVVSEEMQGGPRRWALGSRERGGEAGTR